MTFAVRTHLPSHERYADERDSDLDDIALEKELADDREPLRRGQHTLRVEALDQWAHHNRNHLDDTLAGNLATLELLRRALDSGVPTDRDRDLLLDLALAADLAVAPLRRGRAGLTTPSVVQLVSEDHALAARTIRRHAAGALDALAKVAREGGLGM